MANILGFITNNGKEMLEVDAIPSSGAGTPADPGSLAMYFDGTNGQEYIKIGVADTAWDRILTLTTGNVGIGAYLNIPIYNTNADGYTVSDTVQQNSQNINIGIVAQPTRSAAIVYTIPNPGDAITEANFVLDQGDQTINGDKTFSGDTVFNGSLTVNGTLTYVNSTTTNVSDPFITLNVGGAAGSAAGAGLEFQEGGSVTGSFLVSSDRNGYTFLAPNVASSNTLSNVNLTADRVQNFADTSGTFVMRPNASPGVANQVAYWQDANNLVSNADFTFNPVSGKLTVTNLDVTGATQFANLSTGILHSDSSGNITSSPVVLTSPTQVSGVLPIANGGTNSATALNNGSLMYSAGGAIVEYAAMVPNQLYFGAATTGLPAQSANLYWDIVNARLGIGNSSPMYTLDVTGNANVDGIFSVTNAGNASYQIMQAQVSTTNATVTALQSIAVPNNTEFLIESRVLGRRTSGAGSSGDAASYIRTARFKNVGGVVTLIKTPQTDYTNADVGTWNATFVASGANAVVNVNGATGTSIDWAVTSFVQILS